MVLTTTLPRSRREPSDAAAGWAQAIVGMALKQSLLTELGIKDWKLVSHSNARGFLRRKCACAAALTEGVTKSYGVRENMEPYIT